MPAAAVIPAPIAYINVVAVKKLVVGFRIGGVLLWVGFSPPQSMIAFPGLFREFLLWRSLALSCRRRRARHLL